jgi:hypothetical protein
LGHELTEKIINFVINSPEEENIKIATFIAGMQAQKGIDDCQKRPALDRPETEDGSEKK